MLTPDERSRLDPTVRVEWLEKFLVGVPPEARAIALNGFLADPDPDVPVVIGVIEPELEQLWLRAWGRADDAAGSTPA